jgi:drug/metabolite transporter (DMT)-like permease
MFSLFEVVSKNIQIPPINLTFIRFFIGGSILIIIAITKVAKDKLKIKKVDFIKMWLLGLILIASAILLQIALINTTVSFCVFIYSLNAIFMAFAGWVFLKERPNNVIWFTSALAFIGVGILTNPFEGSLNLYSLIAIVSAVLYSLFNTFMFKVGRIYGNLLSTSISIFFGAISLGVVLLLTGSNLTYGLKNSNIVQILVIGVICSAFVYIMYYKTMEVLSVSIASTVFLIKPVLASILAAIFLKEIPSLTFIIGGILIFISVSISVFSKINKNIKLIEQKESNN